MNGIDDLQELHRDDCFAIRQAARYVSQLYDRHLAQAGMTTTQYTIMCKLRRSAGLTMKQLADAMVMERTTLVRAIQPLQRDGLLTQARAGHNGKSLLLALSAAGQARLVTAHTHWRAAQEEFEQRFGSERAALLRRELFDVTRT
jgi:DNA-binding MarR family transcriptional regulator